MPFDFVSTIWFFFALIEKNREKPLSTPEDFCSLRSNAMLSPTNPTRLLLQTHVFKRHRSHKDIKDAAIVAWWQALFPCYKDKCTFFANQRQDCQWTQHNQRRFIVRPKLFFNNLYCSFENMPPSLFPPLNLFFRKEKWGNASLVILIPLRVINMCDYFFFSYSFF